ncbi:MAG: choice-of-anchor B family protein [Bacteroidia bacterium]|nr:choice-of-anchor B family protein [Bacteroidia bacterium]MCZ2276873.1 choice-of-anchor B family protein [Bacteroidia bacterium]
MKKTILMLACCIFILVGKAQNLNLTLRANLPYSNDLSNIGGYVDSQGTEYALVGWYDGLSIVDVSDPDNPNIIFQVNGPQSAWREVQTFNHYAYVTTEAGNSGLQIINLEYLPDSVQVKTWKGNGSITNQLNTMHTLFIDNGYVYLHGSNLFNGATIICDLNNDPWNPDYLGHTPTIGNSSSYVHDGYVRNDTLYACHIYAGELRIYDCSNKANPVMLASQVTPGQFTHNSWLTQNSKYVFTTDEVSDSYLVAYDISDLQNIQEVDRFQTTPGSQSIVHNVHVIQTNGGEFTVTSWYKDGVIINDVTRPENMVQVASYDTYSQGTGSGFNGCWGVYAFLPSHTIVASDINNGLFVLTPDYIRACYLEGTVTDSVTGSPLNNAKVEITSLSLAANSNITGEYKTGTPQVGNYTVTVSKAGYVTKTIQGVSLTNGNVTILDIELVPVSMVVLLGQVVEAGTLNPIPNAHVSISNAQYQYNGVADANGNFIFSNFIAASYDITAGQWGWRTNCDNQNLTGNQPVTITLDKGYYDDFVFEFGWSVSGSSSNSWERGIPVGTSLQGTPANPGSDVSSDCGDIAFVTDNDGGGAWDSDVDNGNTILMSPVFDALTYTNPVVKYYRWFTNIGNNGGGPPDDTMTVKLTNGISTVTLETILNNTPGNSTWMARSFNIDSLMTPTANMQLVVETADWGPVFNVVEGGFDKFEVVESPLSVNELQTHTGLSVTPTVFNTYLSTVIQPEDQLPQLIQILDVSGRIVIQQHLTHSGYNEINTTQLNPGVYAVRLLMKNGMTRTVRVVKP